MPGNGQPAMYEASREAGRQRRLGSIRVRVVVGVVAGSLALAQSATSAAAEAPYDVDKLVTVVRVKDGDTLVVQGDKRKRIIRIPGLNTMEKGECHAKRATKVLKNYLPEGQQVRITALDRHSRTGEKNPDRPDRYHRYLDVDHGGQSVDPAAEIIKRGLALWMPNKEEYLRNEHYANLAKDAATRGVGLWNSDACGKGPSRKASLRVDVNWMGADQTVTITNGRTKEVDLGGWWIRDSSFHSNAVDDDLKKKARGYTIPDGTIIPGNGALVLHVGPQPAAPIPGHLYWVTENIFNPMPDPNGPEAHTMMGDGAYLFDPQGDLRAAEQYAPRAGFHFPMP